MGWGGVAGAWLAPGRGWGGAPGAGQRLSGLSALLTEYRTMLATTHPERHARRRWLQAQIFNLQRQLAAAAPHAALERAHAARLGNAVRIHDPASMPPAG